MDFQSYACETSGHWNTADCVSPASPGTFTVPGGITAKIYDPTGGGGLTTAIATSAVLDPNIPFRPSAILDTSCPNNPPADAADSRFLNGAGQCVYSRSDVLTFTFPSGTTLTSGHEYVWTVQFNTSHAGYSPIGPASCSVVNPGDPGCGYDSLNVGAMSYTNAPYVGTDVSEDTAYRSFWSPGYVLPITPLGPESGWTGNRPLGQIILN